LLTRADSGLAALHDRNPHYVVLSDGSIRNGYTLRFANKQPVVRRFALTIDASADRRLQDARLDVPGLVSATAGGPLIVEVGPDTTMEIRALVTRPAMGGKVVGGAGEMVSLPVDFVATDDKGVQARVHDFFKMPMPAGHHADHEEHGR
jgi:hypothetical protein